MESLDLSRSSDRHLSILAVTIFIDLEAQSSTNSESSSLTPIGIER
jgi:hypothetical protein